MNQQTILIELLLLVPLLSQGRSAKEFLGNAEISTNGGSLNES